MLGDLQVSFHHCKRVQTYSGFDRLRIRLSDVVVASTMAACWCAMI